MKEPPALDLDATAKLLTETVGGKWEKGLHNLFPASMKILRGRFDLEPGKVLVRYNVFPFGSGEKSKQHQLLKGYENARGARIIGANKQCTVLELRGSRPDVPLAPSAAIVKALKLSPPKVTLKALRQAELVKKHMDNFRLTLR